MDCGHFERWLDEGMPVAEGPAAHAHVASCARCAAALATARRLDAGLAACALRAPAGFVERVMERVARARAARLLSLVETDALPWWVRAAAEPTAALSLALAALLIWQREPLARYAGLALQRLGDPAILGYVNRFLQPRLVLDLGAFSDPLVVSGLMLAVLPLAWWAGLAVYHWSGDPRPLRTARR